DRVLDYAVEAALDLTGAERAFLLLLEPDAAKPQVPRLAIARPLVPKGAATESDQPSYGIVERVIATETPVLTTDARSDERFTGRGSVHAMRLKSVLCVPIQAPTGTIGAFYLDNRVQKGRFSAADLEILTVFAEQAAIAVVNARLLAE